MRATCSSASGCRRSARSPVSFRPFPCLKSKTYCIRRSTRSGCWPCSSWFGRQPRPTTLKKKELFDFYLANTRHVNNWDLVDSSAPHLVGAYLKDRSRKPLYKLASSVSLWERRIAIIATQHFIRHDDFADTLKIGQMLLGDKEDLIHKAVGWMLREVGKREEAILEDFLGQHGTAMPRTMLRYAIERFPAAKRRAYLQGNPLIRRDNHERR